MHASLGKRSDKSPKSGKRNRADTNRKMEVLRCREIKASDGIARQEPPRLPRIKEGRVVHNLSRIGIQPQVPVEITIAHTMIKHREPAMQGRAPEFSDHVPGLSHVRTKIIYDVGDLRLIRERTICGLEGYTI